MIIDGMLLIGVIVSAFIAGEMFMADDHELAAFFTLASIVCGALTLVA